MSRITVATSLVLAITTIAPLPALAQETGPPSPAPSSRSEVLSALFGDLPADADLRVVTMGGTVEEGALLGVADEGFSVSAGGSVHEVDFRDVRTVDVRRSHGLQGALWGAGGGALAGGFFGTMIGSFACSTPTGCQNDEKAGAWRWGTVMGVVGAGIGFWMGRRQVHWHPVFP